MNPSDIRATTRQLAPVFMAIICALTAACGSDTESRLAPVPMASAPSSDEQVLFALDPYDPMYKVDAMGRVTHLRLPGRELPIPALAEIGKLTEVVGIDLAFASVNNEGLAQLTKLQKLRSFGLGGTPVTDDGLQHLEALESLQYLWLSKKNFSTAAIDKLKGARPELNVYLH